jgi:pSer/pThr/pTyr-binding forkhead associated (FHA) protein
MANPLRDFIVPYSKDEVVFKEGDAGAEMYVVQTGQIELFRNMNDEKRFVRVFEKGDFFGEMSLLESQPRTATAVALEDSELIVINGATFDQMIKSNIEIAVRMLRKISKRLRETTDQLELALTSQGKAVVIPDEREPAPAPAEPGEAPPALAEFVSEGSLKVFPIHREISLVGRKDPVTGITPDVDLTEEDVKRSVSRRHAKLICSNGQFYIAEEVGTLNGTFINGKRIPTGVLTPIKSGAQVGFGMLRFKFVERAQAGAG